jgi:nucleoside-diphosphate-sugar epimerase
MAIFKNIYNGFPWYSTGSAGFVSAKDVAEAMYQLMQSDVSAQRFIVSAENKNFQDFFFMVADAFGKKRPSKAVTPFLAAIVWRLEKVKSFFTKKDPLVTKETAESALSTVQFDNSSLLKALPSFAYTPLQQSVVEICGQIVRHQS